MTAKYRFLFAAALVALAPAARAAEPAGFEYVPRDADFVVSARVTKLWQSELFASFRKFFRSVGVAQGAMAALHPDDLDRLTVAFADEPLAVFTTIKPLNRTAVLTALTPYSVKHTVGGKECYRDESTWVAVAFLDDRTVLVGTPAVVERSLRTPPKPDGPHAETLKLAATHDAIFAATDGATGLPTVAKALPDAFKPCAAMLKAKYGAATLDLVPADDAKTQPSKLELRATLRYGSPADAKLVARLLGDLRKLLSDRIDKLLTDETVTSPFDLNAAAELASKGLRGFDIGKADTPPASESELRLASTVREPAEVGSLMLFAAMQNAFTTHVSGHSDLPPKPDTNLKTVAAALLAYAKDHGRLPPPAIYAKDGRTPLLSWRVAILPYLGDEGKTLHARFKLDEPWDSDHNIRLVGRMLRVYAAADERVHATTRFQVFTGPGTLFPDATGMRLKDATDGATRTILIAQSARPVPWSKPQDMAYDAKKPVAVLGSPLGGRLFGPLAQVAFADGSVRSFRSPVRTEPGREGAVTTFPGIDGWADDFDEAALRALITAAGGEKVNPDAGFAKPKAVPDAPPLLPPLLLPNPAPPDLTKSGSCSDRE